MQHTCPSKIPVNSCIFGRAAARGCMSLQQSGQHRQTQAPHLGAPVRRGWRRRHRIRIRAGAVVFPLRRGPSERARTQVRAARISCMLAAEGGARPRGALKTRTVAGRPVPPWRRPSPERDRPLGRMAVAGRGAPAGGVWPGASRPNDARRDDSSTTSHRRTGQVAVLRLLAATVHDCTTKPAAPYGARPARDSHERFHAFIPVSLSGQTRLFFRFRLPNAMDDGAAFCLKKRRRRRPKVACGASDVGRGPRCHAAT